MLHDNHRAMHHPQMKNGCPGSGMGNLFFTGEMHMGHPFLCFEGIRGHPFPETWELRGIRFRKMGIRFSKTPFLEGIKRNQFPLLKLKKGNHANPMFCEFHKWSPAAPPLRKPF